MDKYSRCRSRNFRIVIPKLIEFKDVKYDRLEYLKQDIFEKLKCHPSSYKRSQFQRGLRYYNIAMEFHVDGTPHLDILLIYDKSQQFRSNHFDYLYKHGNLTTYRKLNQAILEYGLKQDPKPLTNMDKDIHKLVQFQKFKSNPYGCLQDEMRKDPIHFCLEEYCQIHDLYQYIPNWNSVKAKIKDSQTAAANLTLSNKPGFKFIDRDLIQESLTPTELKLYDSWKGYSRIVHYLNQIITYKGKRQMKSLNLLITGAPSIGKTALFSNLNHGMDKTCVQDYCAIYPMGMNNWFPRYRSNVYHMIFWNEAKFTSYSFDVILKLLEGSYVDLPCKGGSSRKVDNPLIVMTSNMTLQQMIQQKFGYHPKYLEMAKKNLKVRIQNVVVPSKLDLFILQKLFKPNCS